MGEDVTGDDAKFTYYLDAVDGTFSRSSLTSREDRYPIGDKTVNEMFKIIREQKVKFYKQKAAKYFDMKYENYLK